MSQRTYNLTINGDVNLMKALIAKEYKGLPQLSTAYFYNETSETVWIVLTEDGINPPSDHTDGFPIGTSAPGKDFPIEPGTPRGFDASGVWLHSEAETEIKVLVIGAA